MLSTGSTGIGALPRSQRSARRGALPLLGWLLLLFMPACYGLDMGEPEVFSSVGEPLKAMVSLVDAGGAPLKGQCVVTTKEAASALDGTALTTHVRTKVGKIGASTALRFTTRSPVHAPAIRLVIWVACVRERAVTKVLTLYLVAPEQVSPESAAPSELGVKQAPQKAADSSVQSVQEVSPRQPDPSVHAVKARVVQVASPRPAAQIEAPASAVLPLRLSTVLSASGRGSIPRRIADNGETRLASAGEDSADGKTESQATIAALQQRVGELEASRRTLLQQVHDLQATGDHRTARKGTGWIALMGYAAFGGALLVLAGTVMRERRRSHPETAPSRSRPASGRRAMPVEVPRSAPVTTGHDQSKAAPQRPVPLAVDHEGLAAGPAKVPQNTSPDAPVDGPYADPVEKPSASGSLGLSPPQADAADPGPAVVLLDELHWDDGSSPTADDQTDDPVSEPGAAAEESWETLEEQLREWDHAVAEGISESLEEQPQESDDTAAEGASETFEQELQEWDDAVGELREALYEAELHLLHGSPGEAARILTEQVEGHDAEFLGVRPWTMLFEVYRQQGDEGAFETLAARFRKRFNVAAPAWDSGIGPGTGQGMSLEQQFPHIVDRIMVLWPSSECLAYLSGLLLDDLGGAREGFSLDVAEEIELLRDVMRLQVGEGSVARAQPAHSISPEKRSQSS